MAGNDPPISTMQARGLPDTAQSMTQPRHTPRAPIEPAWDITFTRLTLALGPAIGACVGKLERLFKAMGLAIVWSKSQQPFMWRHWGVLIYGPHAAPGLGAIARCGEAQGLFFAVVDLADQRKAAAWLSNTKNSEG